MKQIILGTVILLLIVAAVMSIAHFFPRVAIGLVLLIQVMQFIINTGKRGNGEA